jgi:predicted hotdog family 3-hydroxylacyl-ACP dehydratase
MTSDMNLSALPGGEAADVVLLDHAGIARLVPHSGSMCWLDALLAWSPQDIVCRAVNHADPDHPLRTASGLLAACGIEYAAQAMALHGGLRAGGLASDTRARVQADVSPGYLASARSVHCHVTRLDDVDGPLRVQATLLAGDDQQALYRFVLADATGRCLVDGRAAVVFNSPLPTPRPGPT